MNITKEKNNLNKDIEKHKRFVNKINNVFDGKIKVIGTYINQKEKVECLCLIHNCKFLSFPSNLTRGHTGCPECKSAKLRKVNLKTSEQFEMEVKEINPHITLLEPYTGSGQNLKCFCKIHHKTFTKYFARLINEHTGCDECYKENIRKRMGKTTEDFKKELFAIHPELIIIGDYINRYTPIDVYCTVHDYYFKSAPFDLLNRNSCCPKSNKFIKEKSIGNILDSWNIKYDVQKSFDDCKDINLLLFDYYLIDYNVVIEYQGEQHYYPVKFGTQSNKEAEEKFKYTKKHDKIKKDFCKKNNILLLEIPYWEYDDLEYFLFDELVKYNVIKEINAS